MRHLGYPAGSTLSQKGRARRLPDRKTLDANEHRQCAGWSRDSPAPPGARGEYPRTSSSDQEGPLPVSHRARYGRAGCVTGGGLQLSGTPGPPIRRRLAGSPSSTACDGPRPDRALDWSYKGQRRTGSSSGATSTSMLRAAPGLRRIQPSSFESEHHLVDRGWGDAEMPLKVSLGRRPAEGAYICVDEGQILTLLRRETWGRQRRHRYIVSAGVMCGKHPVRVNEGTTLVGLSPPD